MRDFGGFGGLDELFGGRQASSNGPRSGADVKITVPLTLAEVATGVEKKVQIKLLDPCDACEGTGAEPGSKSRRCPTCGGAGEVRRAQRSFFGQFVTVGAVSDVPRRRACRRRRRARSAAAKDAMRGDHEITRADSGRRRDAGST